jgi:hypothetical protein
MELARFLRLIADFELRMIFIMLCSEAPAEKFIFWILFHAVPSSKLCYLD